MAFLFESETCSRCGGSGHYSYCQRYGTTCFRCAGKRETLTKRGQAAQNLFTRLLSIPAKDVKPGMKIKESGITNGGDIFTKWATVVDVRYEQTSQCDNTGERLLHQVLVIEADWVTVHGVAEDHMYRVASNASQKAAAAEVAMSYQRSLNKQGKPDKTLAKIVREVAYA